MVILILWFVICDAKTYYGVDFKVLHDEQGTTTETESDLDAFDEDLLDRIRHHLTPQTTSLNMRDVLNQVLARSDNPKLSYYIDEVTSPASKAIPNDITQYRPEAASDEGMFLEYDTQVTPVIDYNTVWPKLFRFKPTNRDYQLNDGLHQMPFKVEWLNRTISTTREKEFITTSRNKRIDKKHTRITSKRNKSSINRRTTSRTRITPIKTKSIFRRNPSRSRSRRTKNTIRKTNNIKSTIFTANGDINKKITIRFRNTLRRKNYPKQFSLISTSTKNSTRRHTLPNIIVDIVSQDDLYGESITDKKKVFPLGVKPSTVPLDFFGFSQGIAATATVPQENYIIVTRSTVRETDDSPFIIDLLENKRAKPKVFLGLNTTLVFPGYDLVTFDNYKKKGPKVNKIMKKIQEASPQITPKTTESEMDKVVKEKWPALKQWFKEVFPKGLIELVPESMSDILSEKSEEDMSDINVKEVAFNLATTEIEDNDKGIATETLQLIRKETVTELPTTIDIIKEWNAQRKLNTEIVGNVKYVFTGTPVQWVDIKNSTETVLAVFMTPIKEMSPAQSVPVYDPPFYVRPLATIPTESSVKQFERLTIGTDVNAKTEVSEGEAMYMDVSNFPSPEVIDRTQSPRVIDTVQSLEITDRAQSPGVIDTIKSLEIIDRAQSPGVIDTVQSLEVTDTVQSPGVIDTVQSLEIVDTVQSPEVIKTVSPVIEDLVKETSLKAFSSLKGTLEKTRETTQISGPDISSTELLLKDKLTEFVGSKYNESADVNSTSSSEVGEGLIERKKDQTTSTAVIKPHVDIPALIDMIANLTNGWSGNLLEMLNKSFLRQGFSNSQLNKTDKSVTLGRTSTTDNASLTIDTIEDSTNNAEYVDNSSGYLFNISEQFNLTEDEDEDVFTMTTNDTFKNNLRYNEKENTNNDSFSNITGVLMGKCFVCGLLEAKIPFDTQCSDAFTKELFPMEPIRFEARQMISSYRKLCLWKNLPHYEESKNRTMSGRWTGGCSVRWIDLHGMYTQRTCRNRFQPIRGKHFLSKQMAMLELALKHRDDGCIVSPVASLVPLSRGVSLYARFHACVCSGNWCNQASVNYQRTTTIVILPLLLERTWTT